LRQFHEIVFYIEANKNRNFDEIEMLRAWSDFYSGTPTEYSQKTGRLTSFSGTAYIKNSFFNGLSSTNGGSIYYDSSSSNLLMLVESSTFINSQATNRGGAIYFSSSGQFVMFKVCGYGCKTTSSYGIFDYIYVTDSISSKNEVHDSVICHTTQTSYYYELYHHYGKVVVKQTNVSSNTIPQVPIRSNPSSNGDSVASSISYSSIANNTLSVGDNIYLSSSYVYEIDSCNIISNTDKGTERAVILTDGSLNLRGSCIVNNLATYVLRNRGGKTVTVTNCTIDPSNKNSGAIVITSTPQTSFINKIKHIETALCYSTYDSFGSLTVAPDTTKSYPCEMQRDKIEIILEMYCNKHIAVDFFRVLNYALMQLFISLIC
jgi:predicted outer membrane repeat protein